MKSSINGKRLTYQNRTHKSSAACYKRVAALQTSKHSRKKGYRIVTSPDSEIMVKYIEKFDYMPERKSEVLKKYDKLALAYGCKG